jgi:putative serine protease PepD
MTNVNGNNIPEETPRVNGADFTVSPPPHSYDGLAQFPPGQQLPPNSAFASAKTVKQKEGKHSKILPLAIGLSLVSALVGGLFGGAVVAYNLEDNATGTTQTETSSEASLTTSNVTATSELSEVIAQKLPSIVTISVMTSAAGGTGSGVVLNDDGYIVTNAHVVTLGGATDTGVITVQTSTGDIYEATLVGYDATADLSVIKIDANAEGISPIVFADSEEVIVGASTIAIGSPLGLSGTVTTGVVSALNRTITVESAEVQSGMQNSNSYQTPAATVALSAIQTDAAINSGNSGGALLDANGNLIGINVAIASSGESTGSIGVGFAIPSDYVKRITSEIIDNGEATHGYLGAEIIDYAAPDTAFTSGAELKVITPNSAASKAGLETGDIITNIGDTQVESATQLVAIIKQHAPGEKIEMTLLRDGKEQNVSVTLEEI